MNHKNTISSTKNVENNEEWKKRTENSEKENFRFFYALLFILKSSINAISGLAEQNILLKLEITGTVLLNDHVHEYYAYGRSSRMLGSIFFRLVIQIIV